MRCTACGEKTVVTQSRVSPTYVERKLGRALKLDPGKYCIQKRRHVCDSCGHRFTTYEFDEYMLKRLIDQAMHRDDLMDAMQVLRETLDRVKV